MSTLEKSEVPSNKGASVGSRKTKEKKEKSEIQDKSQKRETHCKVEERAEEQRTEPGQLQGLGAEMVLCVGCYSSNLKVTSMGK